MPIPFRATDQTARTLAAFMRVVPFPEGGGYDGALFVMNGEGEPVEFCFADVECPRTALWRKRDLARRCAVELARSLLKVCASSPAVLLVRAEEVGPDVFSGELRPDIPVCRVASSLTLAAIAPAEREEVLPESELHLFWSPEPPAADSPVRILVDKLSASGLVTEPFERAEAGLHEVKTGGSGQA